MNFLESTNSGTFDCIKAMLKNSSDEDKILVLAYGYFATIDELSEEVLSWLARDEERELIIIVGIHGKRNSYAVERAKSELVLQLADINLASVQLGVCGLFRLPREHVKHINYDHIHIYAVEHFHSKFTLLLGFRDDGVSGPLGLDWVLHEGVVGSTNWTMPAMELNFELDVHVERSDKKGLRKFEQATNRQIGAAAARVKKSKLSGSVTQELRAKVQQIVKTINRRIDDDKPPSDDELASEAADAERLWRDAEYP